MNVFSTGDPDALMAFDVEPVLPMKRSSSSGPSVRLVRAVAAERDDLQRRRSALLEQRRRLNVKLEEVQAELAEVDERLVLIDRLVGKGPAPARPSADVTPDPPGEPGEPPLRGPAIRTAAVRLLLSHPTRPEAMHYREWFALLTQAGYSVAGKDPLAVFLTQVSRSPLVRRGTQSGVYELDLEAPARLRRQLEELQDQLRALAAGAPTSTTDLSSVRSRRMALNLEISKVEKALEEAEETVRDARLKPNLAAAG